MCAPGLAGGRLVLLATISVLASWGCARQPARPLGDARAPDGPDGCHARCAEWGLAFAGAKLAGAATAGAEGCACQVPKRAQALALQR